MSKVNLGSGPDRLEGMSVAPLRRMSENPEPSDRGWRADVGRWLTQTAASLDDAVDARWRALRRRLGISGRARVMPYLGYATGRSMRVGGRILSDPASKRSEPDDDWWDNLLTTYQQFASNEVPDVEVELQVPGATHSVTSDAEGYFWFDVELDKPLQQWEGWHGTVLRITASPIEADPSPVPVGILAPPSKARFGVISDMDDTVIHTDATSLLTAARLTFLQNGRTRKPLDGVAALYQAFRKGLSQGPELEGNPVFYVSSSAWNLYPLLTDFLDLNDLPAGPLFLRDLGFDHDKFLKSGHDHKLEKALRIMSDFHDLPFVLVGDSGQEDAHLYARAVERADGRVLAVYIRDVDPDLDSPGDAAVDQHLETIRARGVPAMRVAHSYDVARHAASLGLIEPAALQGIRQDTKADAARSQRQTSLPASGFEPSTASNSQE